MKRAVVVFSGGQDSTTCLVQALHQYDEVHCVTFDYGQRHALKSTLPVNWPSNWGHARTRCWTVRC